MLAASAVSVAREAGWSSPEALSSPAQALSVTGRLRALQHEVERLSRWNDPRGAYAHCLCGDD